MSLTKLSFVFLVWFALMVPTIIRADDDDNNTVMDEYWTEKAKEAQAATLKAYHPNPLNVTQHLNYQTRKLIEGFNETRRNLRNKRYFWGGLCWAPNPIDKCWRCDRKWHLNRKKIVQCSLGFGRQTTGGLAAPDYYVVTDPSDDDILNPKPGTLRYAVLQKEPMWIIFGRNMKINLKQELLIQSDKTIDGRGYHIHIQKGAGLSIQFAHNIIIHNIRIHDIVSTPGGMIRDSMDHIGIRGPADGDGISIFGGTNIWIDHVSMSNCADGLIDAVQGSTAITISNCHFTNHNDVLLFGGSDKYPQDEAMQITVAYNHFGHGLIQRMPRCRWGFFHVVNNDYTHWLMYAIGGSSHPTIISQGNRFIAPPDDKAKRITNRNYASRDEWMKWTWRSEGDLMMNGAYFVESGSPLTTPGLDLIKPQPGHLVNILTRFSGPLSCKRKKMC